MVVGVNEGIGQSICMDSPDILVAGSTAAMFHQGNKVGGLLAFYFHLVSKFIFIHF